MKKWKYLSVMAAGLAVVLVAALLSKYARTETAAPKPAQLIDLDDLKSKAVAGDREAQFRLGQFYAKGDGTKPDYDGVAHWYRKAADARLLEAQTALGELYEAGSGVPLNLAEAAKLYRRAAEKGEVGAQYNLAAMLQAGRGMEKDHVEATKWFRAAANQGEPLAEFNLGQRYELGIGVAVDRVDAFKWLSLAAANGIPDAADRRDKLKSQLTKEELREAKKRIAAFVPRKTIVEAAEP